MTPAAPEHGHDLLVVADRIHTCSPAGSVEALLVRNGRITASGLSDDLRVAAAGAPLLALRGSTITPGLTDAHAHLTEWAFARREVDLSHTRSPAAAAALVARAPLTASGWVRGRGWNPHTWDEQPTRTVLDEYLPHV